MYSAILVYLFFQLHIVALFILKQMLNARQFPIHLFIDVHHVRWVLK